MMGRVLVAAVVVLAGAAAGQAQELPSGTALVANMNANSVWLVDLPSGVRRGVIQTHADPHEVAVSRDGRFAAVTNYGGAVGNLVQIIDISAAEVVEEIVVEGYRRLHGVAFMEGDSLLALTSERTGEVLVVGRADGGLRRTLPTRGQASHMLSQGGAWIYTANIVDGTVSRIDPDGIEATLAWPAGSRTEGLVATPDGGEVWTGSMEGGEVVGIEGATGSVVARVVGLQVPYRLGVTPDGARVVVSDPGGGAIGVIRRASGTLEATVDVNAAASEAGLGADPSPQGFAVLPDGAWVLVSAKAVDRIAVVSLRRMSVVRFIETGSGPDGVAFSPVKVR